MIIPPICGDQPTGISLFQGGKSQYSKIGDNHDFSQDFYLPLHDGQAEISQKDFKFIRS